jgi:hypothetical protein
LKAALVENSKDDNVIPAISAKKETVKKEIIKNESSKKIIKNDSVKKIIKNDSAKKMKKPLEEDEESGYNTDTGSVMTDYTTDTYGDNNTEYSEGEGGESAEWQEFWDEQAEGKYWYNNISGMNVYKCYILH